MDDISKEQIRQFRLHTHHLDKWYQKADVESAAGACGFQNTPPGAWEIEVTLWDVAEMLKTEIQDLVDRYALFQQLKLNRVEFT
ncbi:MAG: hypothetical protein GX491_15220 [Chloroflexi bacterium]|nr:hypothetical protein [Chloroflexota bacterium]